MPRNGQRDATIPRAVIVATDGNARGLTNGGLHKRERRAGRRRERSMGTTQSTKKGKKSRSIWRSSAENMRMFTLPGTSRAIQSLRLLLLPFAGRPFVAPSSPTSPPPVTLLRSFLLHPLVSSQCESLAYASPPLSDHRARLVSRFRSSDSHPKATTLAFALTVALCASIIGPVYSQPVRLTPVGTFSSNIKSFVVRPPF